MNRQAEYILIIIGAVFSILSAIFYTIYAIFLGSGIEIIISASQNSDGFLFKSSIIIIFSVIFLILVAIAVFGFIAASKIKKDASNVNTYAVILIVMGGLQIVSIQGILFLTAGILLVTKKTPQVPLTKNESEDKTKWE